MVFSLVLSQAATWFFKKCSEPESHLDIGEHCHIRRNFDAAYDRLKRDWVEKFLSVDKKETIRFTCEVKQYLSTKSDLAERTGMKVDPGKVAAYMRMTRNPDSSRMFERKDWLTSQEIGGCKKETGKPRS